MATAEDPLANLGSDGWERVQSAVRRFRDDLRAGRSTAIEDASPADGPDRLHVLRELAHEELEFRLKAGEPTSAEEYLARFPELAGDPAAALSLILAADRFWAATPAGAEAGGASRPTPTDPPAALGNYERIEEVGRGAFAAVYRAIDRELDRVVAVKLAHRGGEESAEEYGRFLREARSAAALSHPHIVAVHDAGRIGGRPYLVAEFIDGLDLSRRLAGSGRPPWRQAADWVARLADALAHAHRAGVVHRDVKPSNILIGADDRPYLTDFGLARRVAVDAILTLDGQLLGTPAYMAPEQARGDARAVGAPSDIYGLGVVLYELLTGSAPFRGSGRLLLSRIVEEEPRRPRSIDRGIPRDLETICLKAMAKEPAHRYPTADALAEDLRRFLRGEPVAARPSGLISSVWRRCRRHPRLAASLGLLALALVGGLLDAGWQWRRAERFRRLASARRAEIEGQRAAALERLGRSHRAMLAMADAGHRLVLGRLDEPAQRAAMGRSLASYREFIESLRSEPSLRPELWDALRHVAEIVAQVGPRDEARLAWAEYVELGEALRRERPEDAETRERLADGHHRLAAEQERTGRATEAGRSYRRAADLWSESLEQIERSGRGRAGRAEVEARLARALAELGRVRGEAGETEEAIDALRRAVQIGERLIRDRAPDADLPRLLGNDCYDLAWFLRASGRRAEALRFAERSLTCWDRPGVGPRDDATRLGVARASYLRGALLNESGRPAEALSAYRRAADLFTVLVEGSPLIVGHRRDLAASRHNIGNILSDLGRFEEARDAYRRSAGLREALHEAEPSVPGFASDCGGTWQNLGEALERLGRADEAAEAFAKAAGYQRRACAGDPDSARYRRYLEGHLRALARVRREEHGGPPAEAGAGGGRG